MKKKTDQQNEIDLETRRDVAWTVKSLLIKSAKNFENTQTASLFSLRINDKKIIDRG